MDDDADVKLKDAELSSELTGLNKGIKEQKKKQIIIAVIFSSILVLLLVVIIILSQRKKGDERSFLGEINCVYDVQTPKTSVFGNDFVKNSRFYYLCPICIIKNKKNLETLLFVKNSICNCFSLETFIEFIKIEKAVKVEKKLKATDILYTKYGTSKNLKEEINKIFSLN